MVLELGLLDLFLYSWEELLFYRHLLGFFIGVFRPFFGILADSIWDFLSDMSGLSEYLCLVFEET